MERLKKLLACFISILLITLTLPNITFANSAEPPSLTVIVSFPSDDLSGWEHWRVGEKNANR